ncbi:hypothetical protein EBZ35_03660 [bacterium]|nr:hypothetical protein [bacterium]
MSRLSRWVVGIWMVGCGALMANDEVKYFDIDQVVDTSWGKLISVYDQPTLQRMTFESDTAITVLQLGLTWDNKENTYRPSVKQVITLKKRSGSLTSP